MAWIGAMTLATTGETVSCVAPRVPSKVTICVSDKSKSTAARPPYKIVGLPNICSATLVTDDDRADMILLFFRLRFFTNLKSPAS